MNYMIEYTIKQTKRGGYVCRRTDLLKKQHFAHTPQGALANYLDKETFKNKSMNTKQDIIHTSWDENIKHYNVNKVDWALIIGTAFMIAFGLVGLLVLVK